MWARRYTPDEYLEAIRKYPKYWDSVRPATERVASYAEEIQQGIDELRVLYPDLKPAKVYFEIGIFRTPGTAFDSLVIIGAEMAMGDSKTDVSELPEGLDYVRNYLKTDPVRHLSFLNVHEFVHTQQTAQYGYDLLSQTVFEGIPEFLATLAVGSDSPNDAIAYGEAHANTLKQIFCRELFSRNAYHWFNNPDGLLPQRDLGYYIGYAIARSYYEQAEDKSRAIAELIELEYNDRTAVELLVESTGFFGRPLTELKKKYEESRPRVVSLTGFQNGATDVDPNLDQFTIHFDRAVDTRFRSTDFGLSGSKHYPEIKTIEFSPDGLSARYTISLQPATDYEMKVDVGYRDTRAIPLVPFLIRFRTADE